MVWVFFCVIRIWTDLRVGAILREQNTLPYKTRKRSISSAKDDVNNVGAGRAAKGASPASSSKKTDTNKCVSNRDF